MIINHYQILIIEQMNSEVYGPVLLVCIYNKFGNIITHDYFYQLFGQHGDIVKILIFEKAKVWKTFVEFTDSHSARVALVNLNNHVVFEDGSKMNIFPSKLKHIRLQNSNLGGVNYEQLKVEQESALETMEGVRGRRSTFQDHTSSLVNSYDFSSTYVGGGKGSAGELQSTFSFESHSNKKGNRSYNSFDIDEQFLELARESEEFRELELEREESLKESIRRKSKTIVTNPNVEQFVFQNSPSKVLFVRSVPEDYSNKCLYNIFRNFGNVLRVIYMRDKTSGLVEFDSVDSAICAKDQINYAKAQIKIFYSHYDTLSLRKETQGQQFQQYNRLIKNNNNNINPPSEVLYLTMIVPQQEQEVRDLFEKAGCPIGRMEWKQNGKDRWMCLSDLGNIQKSLLGMGLLQATRLSNGKELKLSFTRSKLSKVCSSQDSF